MRIVDIVPGPGDWSETRFKLVCDQPLWNTPKGEFGTEIPTRNCVGLGRIVHGSSHLTHYQGSSPLGSAAATSAQLTHAPHELWVVSSRSLERSELLEYLNAGLAHLQPPTVRLQDAQLPGLVLVHSSAPVPTLTLRYLDWQPGVDTALYARPAGVAGTASDLFYPEDRLIAVLAEPDANWQEFKETVRQALTL